MEYFKNNKIMIIVGVIVVSIVCLFFYFYVDKEDNTINTTSAENIEIVNERKEEAVESKKIIIHVAGEVNNPGLVECEKGCRIIDAVNKAGGFTDKANIDRINLAYEVQDKQKIVIPNIEENEMPVIDESRDFVFKDNNARRKNKN